MTILTITNKGSLFPKGKTIVKKTDHLLKVTTEVNYGLKEMDNIFRKLGKIERMMMTLEFAQNY